MRYLKKLLKDKVIKYYYSMAKKNKNYYAKHDLKHAIRVMKTCKKLALELNIASKDIENICISALLHDVGASKFGKDGHAERSYEIAKLYTKNDKILNAILFHSDGHNSDYGFILTLADKLDICKNRLTNLGKKQLSVRQFNYINSLNFKIINGLFVLNIKSNKKIDLNELNNYYFTKKIFNSIKNFTDYFNLTYKVYLNKNEWLF